MVDDCEMLRQIKLQAASDRHLQECLIAAVVMEGGSLCGPWPPGDQGCSRGGFQIKTWDASCLAGGTWRGHPISIADAENPATAVAYAIKYEYDAAHDVMAGLNYRGNAATYPSPIDVAYHSERPAHYYSEAQQAKARAAIRDVFGSDGGGGVIEQPPIVWIGAHLSNYDNGRGGVSPEAVVWHVAEGSLAGIDSWFNDARARASTEFAVGKNGAVHQYVDLGNTPYAHGIVEIAYADARALIQANWGINPNLWAHGIEFEGTTAEVLAGIVPTPVQLREAARLTAWLFAAKLWDPAAGARPPVDRDHILMHRDISPRSRTCPVWQENVQDRGIALVQSFLAPVPPPPPPDPDPPTPPATDYRELYRVELVGEREAAYADAVIHEEQAGV